MDKSKSYYFIGICGIGMSSLAQLVRSCGYRVRGSDLNPDVKIVNLLASQGIQIYRGHKKGRLDKTDIVIYSTAIGEENPEYQEASHRGLNLIHRIEALKEFLKGRKVISVTGTHGKTTTTYLLGKALRDSGSDLGIILGGIPRDLENNFIKSNSGYLLELDESDGRFLEIESEIKVVTSLDLDHLEFYQGEFAVLKSRFRSFLNKKGINIVCWDDFHLREIISSDGINYLSYGFEEGANYRGEIIEIGEWGTKYRLKINGTYVTDVELPILGYKTALNSLSLFALGELLGSNLRDLVQSLQNLKGVERRYEIKFSSPKLKIFEDYAHHPREIEEVIVTIRNYLRPRRIVVVFQPHRYTRTKYLWQDFKTCFKEADILLLTDIYSAFEKEIPGIDSFRLAQDIDGIRTLYSPLSQIPQKLLNLIEEGDIILILGAGNINKICQPLVEKLNLWR